MPALAGQLRDLDGSSKRRLRLAALIQIKPPMWKRIGVQPTGGTPRLESIPAGAFPLPPMPWGAPAYVIYPPPTPPAPLGSIDDQVDRLVEALAESDARSETNADAVGIAHRSPRNVPLIAGDESPLLEVIDRAAAHLTRVLKGTDVEAREFLARFGKILQLPPAEGVITLAPLALAQQTAVEVRTVAEALSDAHLMQNWTVGTNLELRHHRRNHRHETLLQAAPLLPFWGTDTAIIEQLQKELRSLDFGIVLLAYVAIGLAVRDGRVTMALSELVKAIGLRPRGKAARAEAAREVYRRMHMIAALQVVGKRKGRWRDPVSGEEIDTISEDPLIAITGKRKRPHGELNDPEPVEISWVAGEFIAAHIGNRSFLPEYGDVSRVARIPARQAAGAWAHVIGITAQQRWRERDARGGPDQYRFTRRELLENFPTKPDYVELLGGRHPHRADQYFTQAIQLLQQRGCVGEYSAPQAPPSTTGNKVAAARWGELWLDQVVELRPPVAAGARRILVGRTQPSRPAG